MNSKNPPTLQRFFWFALIITVIRITYLFFNHRDLDVEESQYWAWSRHLALGYHSKPPMISWAIYFTTHFFGNSEWAVRLCSPITYLFTSLFLYGASFNLYKRTIAFWAGMTVLVLPGVTYSSSIISTDPFLIMFWSLALYSFIRGCQTTRLYWWALCGLALGLGLLSKYTMLIFLLSAGLYFICATEIRAPMKKLGPYLALLIAAAVFAPNIWWNMHHANAAIHHVVAHNIDLHPKEAQGGLNWESLGLFLLSQLGLLGPILFMFLIVAVIRSRKLYQYREASRLLICFTLPIFLMICVEALLSRAYGNWGVAAYPSGIILAVAYMWELDFRRWLKFSIWLHGLAALVFYGWELAVAYGYYHHPLPAHPNWKDFGAAIYHDHTLHPGTFYLVGERELWSKTLYYGRVPENNLFVWDPQNQVDWLDTPRHPPITRGNDFIYLSTQAQLPSSLKRVFKKTGILDKLSVNQRLRGRQEFIYVYYLQSYTT